MAGYSPTPITPGQEMDAALSKLSPYVSTFSQQGNTGTVAPQKLQATSSNGTILQNLANFAGTFAAGVGGMAMDAMHGLGSAAVDTVEAPFKFVGNLLNEGHISSQIDANNRQMQSLQAQTSKLSNDYRMGRITQVQYKNGLNNLNSAYSDMQKNVNETNSQAQQNATDTLNTGITTVSDLIGIVTAGSSEGLTLTAEMAAKEAGDGTAGNMIKFFGQREVGDQLFGAATKIDTVVTDFVGKVNKLTTWDGLLPQGKIALLSHDAIVSGADHLSSQQIAKNVAVNLLLKRPLVYQTNIDLATDLYKNMASGNLSGAALETVLIGSMALSGGPIGWAMESLGKAGDTLKAAMFPKGFAADVMKVGGSLTKEAQDYVDKAAKQTASRQSFNNNVSMFIGDGTQGQIDRVLAEKMAAGKEADVLMWKVLEQTNMQRAGGNAATAAGYLKDFYASIGDGGWMGTKSAEELINHGITWARNRELVVQDAIKNGMARNLAERIVLGRMDSSDKQLIIKAMAEVDAKFGSVFTQSDTPVSTFKDFTQMVDHGHADFEKMGQLQDARLQALADLIDRYPNAAWTNSETFLTELRSVIKNTAHSTQDMAKAIQKIRAGKELQGAISPEVQQQIAKDGHLAILPKRYTYTPYVSPEEASKNGLTFKSNAVPKEVKNSPQASLFEHAVAPVPILQSFGKLLQNIGLSPEGTQELVQQQFRANFNGVMKQTLTDSTSNLKSMDGETVLTKLYDEIRAYNGHNGINLPITDLRQLTTTRIKGALGADLTDAEAKAIMASINTSMLGIPLSLRGLGDKIQDINLAANPLARWFSRVQGSGRFVWNPFFRTQQAYQTEMLTQMEAKAQTGSFKIAQLPFLNRVNETVFGHQWNEVQNTLSVLETREIFAPHIQSSQMVGIEGRIGTRITKSEKQSLAGLVTQLSKNAGYTDVGKYVGDNEPEVIDLLRTITTNNHTVGTLDSPLVRSINLAFFPFRYNMKVAGLMADKLSLLSAPTQVALLAGIYNFNDWLRSDNGVAWQQQHSQALGLMSWLSPAYPISYIVKLGEDAIHPEEASVGDMGMLGGLPFGFIGQFLQSAGLIDMSPPYVNPTTGEVYPKYIPQTNKALVNLALQDMIGQVFTYPGAIVGLPSKGSILRGFTNAVVGGKNDFTPQAVTLTPYQQHQQQIIQQQAEKQGTAKATGQPLAQPAKVPDNQITTVPQPDVTAPPRPTAGRSTRKKKSDYRPAPL